MAASGDTFSTLLREVWTPELIQTLFWNTFPFDGTFGPMVTPPGGDSIDTGYLYSVSTNAAAYDYDDVMPTADNSSQIRAAFTKTWYQGAAQTYGQYRDMQQNGGTYVGIDQDRMAIELATKNLVDVAAVALLGELETQLDAANTYSDTALTRATYDMVTYEEDTSTALTMAHLEDMIEALENVTYMAGGARSRKEYMILMPRNQLTNLSRLTGGGAYNTLEWHMNTNIQDMSPVDAGRTFRLAAFEGIDLVVVPDQTSTTLLMVHKPSVKIFENRALTIKEKDVQADSTLWHLTCGYNLVAANPKIHGKLSDKTA